MTQTFTFPRKLKRLSRINSLHLGSLPRDLRDQFKENELVEITIRKLEEPKKEDPKPDESKIEKIKGDKI